MDCEEDVNNEKSFNKLAEIDETAAEEAEPGEGEGREVGDVVDAARDEDEDDDKSFIKFAETDATATLAMVGAAEAVTEAAELPAREGLGVGSGKSVN